MEHHHLRHQAIVSRRGGRPVSDIADSVWSKLL
jgi:hypothetical protein